VPYLKPARLYSSSAKDFHKQLAKYPFLAKKEVKKITEAANSVLCHEHPLSYGE